MTLTLTLSPDRQTWLQAQARTAGVSPEEYALRLLDDAARSGDDAAMHQSVQTPEQKASSFLEWAGAQNTDAPPLPLEATSREALYADDRADDSETQRAA